MKAIRVHAYHEQPGLDDVPEPAVSGPLDVIVEVGDAGLCRTDLHILEGQWAERNVTLPYALGHENAGWVREVGPGVTNVTVSIDANGDYCRQLLERRYGAMTAPVSS